MARTGLFAAFQGPVGVVGHRGVRRPGIAENTPAAFAAAVAEGADAVELDVRRCADGTVIVHHDPVTPSGRVIVDTPAADLAAEGIATFAEVLAGLPATVAVDVEVKNLPHEPDFDESESLVAAVADVLADADVQRSLLVTSFSPFTVAALAEALPDVERGLVTLSSVGIDTAAALAAEYNASVICPQLGSRGLDVAGIAGVHGAGLRVMAWELGCVDALGALAVTGIDAICVDDPAAARGAVAKALGDDRERARQAAQLD